MGGRIALEVALAHPRRVDRLVLVSTSAAGRGQVHMSWPMRLLGLLQWLPGLQGRYPQPQYAQQRQRQAAVSYNAADRLGQLHAPTLILHGRRDRSVPLGWPSACMPASPARSWRCSPAATCSSCSGSGNGSWIALTGSWPGSRRRVAGGGLGQRPDSPRVRLPK